MLAPGSATEHHSHHHHYFIPMSTTSGRSLAYQALAEVVDRPDKRTSPRRLAPVVKIVNGQQATLLVETRPTTPSLKPRHDSQLGESSNHRGGERYFALPRQSQR